MDAKTLDDLAEYFQEKLGILNTVMDLRHANKEEGEDYQSHVVSLESELDNLMVVIALMRTEVSKQRERLKETQDMKTSVETMVDGLKYALSNIPTRMPKPVQKETVKIREKPVETSKTLAEQNVTATVRTSSKENQPPKNGQTGGRKVTKTKNLYIPTIEYITVEEFENVPKYIKGRATYNQVNAIIDELNKAYKEKYKILAMKRSTLNDVKRKRFEKFKLQETKETTGEHFIVDDDVKEFANVKMDSVFRSMLTLLRHCGRIKEIRGGGHTRYACMEVY